MNQPSVEERFRIEPEVSGTFRWNGPREIVFQPDAPLAFGETYTVQIASGAQSENGSSLQDDLRFSFTVDFPRVVYLSADRNLIMVDLNTSDAVPLIDSEFDIADYAVDATGNLIAHTLVHEDGTSDIWVHNLTRGRSTQITDCQNAACIAPAWNADGTQIAYEREEFDELFGQVAARRIWVVDLATARSRLLFDDTQITGHSPEYPPMGTRFAMFATNPPGILVYDFVDGSQIIIESLQGVTGNFSSDGRQLIYPLLVMGDVPQTFFTQLEMLDLNSLQRIAVTGTPADAIEDRGGFWRPGHPDELAVLRRYLTDNYTDGPQVYLMNVESGEVTPLVVDPDYDHSSLVWSADGNLLLMQRFNRAIQGARTEIWLYDLRSQELQMIANDAFLPGFVR
jgi:Tol biopolymer transport system component